MICDTSTIAGKWPLSLHRVAWPIEDPLSSDSVSSCGVLSVIGYQYTVTRSSPEAPGAKVGQLFLTGLAYHSNADQKVLPTALGMITIQEEESNFYVFLSLTNGPELKFIVY